MSVTHFLFGSVAVKSRFKTLGATGMDRISFGGQHPTPFAQGCQGCLTHQPGYPFAGGSAPLIFQFAMDTRASISALVREKKPVGLLASTEHSSRVCWLGRALAPGIKATFRDSKNIAHDHNGTFVLVLFNKLIVHLESREKMLTPFFEYSRSCWTRSNSRLRRRFSSSKAV